MLFGLVLGMFIGAFVGVSVMCLFYYNKNWVDKDRTLGSGCGLYHI